MSELRVDSVKSKGGGAPNLPKGVTISGITTAVTLGVTNIDGTNVNVSGVVTSGTLSGELLSTGTPTLGLGVTINSSGVVISGVATAGIVSATTLYGDGTNITGVGASIAPLFYNPDASDSSVSSDTGIGITFNQQIKAGTGNITIRETNASGTVVENFGVGSSVTISENRVSFTPTSELDELQLYHLSYPSGCFTNNEGTDYVGTAYTFKAFGYLRQLWVWGNNGSGRLGQNQAEAQKAGVSSPVQVPGTTWAKLSSVLTGSSQIAIKTDGTLWAWGDNPVGALGLNDTAKRSSPAQIAGTTWNEISLAYRRALATKTDGTLWIWGYNEHGQLGQNNIINYSSPVQVGSETTWNTIKYGVASGKNCAHGVKTDGTLWSWGDNGNGALGTNQPTSVKYSSPVQVPGTTWSKVTAYNNVTASIRTDGTLWMWGANEYGDLAQNNTTEYSSPKQIPGTTWSAVSISGNTTTIALKTDGTMWAWGKGYSGQLGINVSGNPGPGACRSSPVQIPGTTWSKIISQNGGAAIRTDGTLWNWGRNIEGFLGHNQGGENSEYSSPTQVPGTDWHEIGASDSGGIAIKKI